MCHSWMGLCSGHENYVVIRELSLYPQSLLAKLTDVVRSLNTFIIHVSSLSVLYLFLSLSDCLLSCCLSSGQSLIARNPFVLSHLYCTC